MAGMNIIHAEAGLYDIGVVTGFDRFDAQIKDGGELTENTFSLEINARAWAKQPILNGHYLYIDGTEWGGPVYRVQHNTATGMVTAEGPLWRGMLMQRVLMPDAGSPYMTITGMDANAAIGALIGASYDGLFSVSPYVFGVTLSGQFRFPTILAAIESLLATSGLKPAITYSAADKCVYVYARTPSDYSDGVEISQDYGIQLISARGRIDGYNHIIALGSGELLDRQIVHVYRTNDGQITTTRPEDWSDAADLSTTYDYSGAETLDKLTAEATRHMEEYSKLNSIEMDMQDTTLALQLGDIVGARDRLTGLAASATVSEMILTIDGAGVRIQTKVV